MSNTVNEVDELQLDTRIPGEGGARDCYILSQGEYMAEISAIEVIKQLTFDKKSEETVVKITFKTLEAATEDDEVDPEDIGLHGMISAWPRLTAYELEEPKDGTPSALTTILDNIFRRKLTEEEAKRLSIKRLIGIQGKLMVGTSKGARAKFDSFRTAKNKTPKPEDYFRPEGVAAVPASKFEAKREERKLDARPKPKQVTGDVDDIPNPYAE
jgi:hypothetical protein